MNLSQLKKLVPFESILKKEDLDEFYDSWEKDFRQYAQKEFGSVNGYLYNKFGEPKEILDNKTGRMYICWPTIHGCLMFVAQQNGSMIENFDLFSVRKLKNISIGDSGWYTSIIV